MQGIFNGRRSAAGSEAAIACVKLLWLGNASEAAVWYWQYFGLNGGGKEREHFLPGTNPFILRKRQE